MSSMELRLWQGQNQEACFPLEQQTSVQFLRLCLTTSCLWSSEIISTSETGGGDNGTGSHRHDFRETSINGPSEDGVLRAVLRPGGLRSCVGTRTVHSGWGRGGWERCRRCSSTECPRRPPGLKPTSPHNFPHLRWRSEHILSSRMLWFSLEQPHTVAPQARARGARAWARGACCTSNGLVCAKLLGAVGGKRLFSSSEPLPEASAEELLTPTSSTYATLSNTLTR